MELAELLPLLLGLAWLLPLASFALVLAFGPRMGPGGRGAGFVATGAILAALVLSIVALGAWLVGHPLPRAAPAGPIAGDWYAVCRFGSLELTVGYYIDGLTILMFSMVTVVASCIHVYSFGYMHDEQRPVTDPLATLADGRKLTRRGRFHRFYQYLSLFSFSMLGLILAGNLFMLFVFWELVGICSYLLIGFYFERKSASIAAGKAFLVNRVGDFGMIVGMMALWGGLGTLAFDEVFERAQPGAVDHWLLIVAGLGIFCGCVGKSAQFPLHVWLPDAMEGPTPVSALIHAATMVAAGVYLVGRFYPVLTPEVLLVIAYVGGITLLLAAAFAVVATDIKRVLAYSTISQLGYMMLALGVGGWVAGLLHLVTHAFFKSLLFLGAGSVIHAAGTTEMFKLGGLRKKMPWTAGTMLVGCVAISGIGLPLAAIGRGTLGDVGLSGFHSKDAILAAAMLHKRDYPQHALLFYLALVGAAITAFYVFRLWYLTFAGKPRDRDTWEHARESSWVMLGPLVVLAVFAIAAAWRVPLVGFSVSGLLEQAVPSGVVSEHLPEALHGQVSLIALGVALLGFATATVYYGLGWLNAERAKRVLPPIYLVLRDKLWFDELYSFLFVRPTLRLARLAAGTDRNVIDRLADGLAGVARTAARLDDLLDRVLVDGLVNAVASWTYRIGVSLRAFQSGNLRQYVVTVAVGTVALFVLISIYWSLAATAN